MEESIPRLPAHTGRWDSYPLTADGSPIHLRPIAPDDVTALVEFHDGLSAETVYYRFFHSHPRLTPEELENLVHIDEHNRMTLVALAADRIVGVGSYDRWRPEMHEAEVAFVVDDEFQGRGIGTLLLERLAAIAAAVGIQRFVAQVLPGNRRMLDVFRSSGFEESARVAGDVVEVVLPVGPTPRTTAVVARREHLAEVRSIDRLLTPSSVAVVGASDRPGSAGQTVMSNLLRGGFAGPIHPVNRAHDTIAGGRAYPSVLDVPDPVDLAVVAVPLDRVAEVVQHCAAKQVANVVVLAAGSTETGPIGPERQRALVDVARRHGMRLVGPDSLGVANTAVALDATGARCGVPAGNVAFLSRTPALGMELLAGVAAGGVGVSSFVSIGNVADVSGEDLLHYWEEDPHTDVIVVDLAAFGNPWTLVRLARRVSCRKPIVALERRRAAPAGGGLVGSLTAGVSPPTALGRRLEQAGVIRVDTLAQLFGTAAGLARPGRGSRDREPLREPAAAISGE